MSPIDLDQRVRLAAFEWLREQVVSQGGYVLPWSLLRLGFPFEGRRVHLVSQQGIFKPAVLPLIPLSIRSSLSGDYDDGMSPDGHLLYRYRGTDPAHRENVGLRTAGERMVPLVYFRAIVSGRYLAAWPVYVCDDDPAALTFTVDLSAALCFEQAGEEPAVLERRYRDAAVRQRLHQHVFREQVLEAYRERCSICTLGHRRLLDAAHIIPDSDPAGQPVVPNGLALCKLHHAAYDANFLGVRPDSVVEVRWDILEEEDGPMLIHGLKALHQSRLWLPRPHRLKPDPERLAIRYEKFRAAG